jgi:hypothetical protein
VREGMPLLLTIADFEKFFSVKLTDNLVANAFGIEIKERFRHIKEIILANKKHNISSKNKYTRMVIKFQDRVNEPVIMAPEYKFW